MFSFVVVRVHHELTLSGLTTEVSGIAEVAGTVVSDRRRSAAVSSFSDDDSGQFRRLSQCRHVRTDAMASISLLPVRLLLV